MSNFFYTADGRKVNLERFGEVPSNDTLSLKGNLDLAGRIKASKFLFDDGTEMKTVVQEQKVAALPENVSFDAQGNMIVGGKGINNKLKISNQWSEFASNDGAEISNDTKEYKTLMIVGNTSAGGPRSVGVWDKLTVHGQLCVRDKCVDKNTFGTSGAGATSKDPVFTGKVRFANADGGDDSDPYFLQKVQKAGNENSLRLTINDDANESFQIWGNSCGAGDCGGEGKMQHNFVADGNVEHKGKVKSAGFVSGGGDNINKYSLDDNNVNTIGTQGWWTVFRQHSNEGWKFNDQDNKTMVQIKSGTGDVEIKGNTLIKGRLELVKEQEIIDKNGNKGFNSVGVSLDATDLAKLIEKGNVLEPALEVDVQPWGEPQSIFLSKVNLNKLSDNFDVLATGMGIKENYTCRVHFKVKNLINRMNILRFDVTSDDGNRVLYKAEKGASEDIQPRLTPIGMKAWKDQGPTRYPHEIIFGPVNTRLDTLVICVEMYQRAGGAAFVIHDLKSRFQNGFELLPL
jgi:hypothetical protein